jgi:hypothetical protein
MYQETVAQVAGERERQERERRPLEQLRSLVGSVDYAVERCEETHLDGIKRMTPELRSTSSHVRSAARSGPSSHAMSAGLRALEKVLAHPSGRIVDLMDSLWRIQEAAFDLLVPYRNQLPEDVEEVEDLWAQAAA